MQRSVISVFFVFLVACPPPVKPNQTVTLGDVNHTETAVTSDTKWGAGTHTIQESLTISGAILTVESCSTIKFVKSGATIKVQDGGGLKMIGTADCPILITSEKASKSPGDWKSIEFYDSAAKGNCIFDYVNVEYGGGDGTQGAIWLSDNASLAMSHSSVKHSASYGVEALIGAELRDFKNNELTLNAKEPLSLFANTVGAIDSSNGFTGNQSDGIRVLNDPVSRTATWIMPGVPYLLPDGLTVAGTTTSALLTISAGATLKMGPQSYIVVKDNGALILAGTPAAKVTVTTAQPVENDVAGRGSWSRIEIYGSAAGASNSFRNAVIEYGGAGTYGEIWLEDSALLEMLGTTVRHSASDGLQGQLGAQLRNFSGNTITANAEHPISFGANHIDQIGTGTYTGNGTDSVLVLFERVEHNATWADIGVPYQTPNGFNVGGEAVPTLTLSAGVTVKMDPEQLIAIQDSGTLVTAGTSAKHVTITSSKQPVLASDWARIELYSNGNSFTYTDISAGGFGNYGQVWLEDGAGLTLSNTTFSTAPCDLFYDTATVTPGTGFVKCP